MNSLKKYEHFDNCNKELKEINLYSKAIDIYNNYISKVNDGTEYKLIESLLCDNKYKKRISDDTFYNYLQKISKIDNKEDMDIIIDEIKALTDNISQLNTVDRLINTKILKYSSGENIKKFVTKNCPHCDKETTSSSDTYYNICGYSKKGFDWKGCGYDWCFNCSKKLCKSWPVNHLYNVINRYHTNCCKNHALITGGVYPDDYCQCETEFVCR